jgi:leucyl aminopeptidase
MIKLRLRGGRIDEALPVLIPVGPATTLPAALQPAAAASGLAWQPEEVAEILAPRHAVLSGFTPAAAWRCGGAGIVPLLGCRRVAIDARGLPPAAAAGVAAGALLRAWRPPGAPGPAPRLARIDLMVDDPEAADPAWQAAEAAARATLFARDLVAEPGNRLTPRGFAARLKALEAHDIAVDVLSPRGLREAGCGALLAVGRAAAEGPRLVVLRRRGRIKAPPVAFVGKGITFDTGGISIKPAAGMAAMRADMAGAAACAGAMLALALRRSPAPAVAVLAIAENAVGAEAWRPGDVVTTLSGRTVEVIDTDAEGRMVLADALHYACARFAPSAVIDLATLTGAIVTALGHHRAGLFGNDAPLGAALAAAGEATGEQLWPMPIGQDHRAALHSDIADIRQCSVAGGGGWAQKFLPDACHAAAFLREFVGTTPWAHLDIAAMETAESAHALGPAGATGFGVRLLDALVAARYESAP